MRRVSSLVASLVLVVACSTAGPSGSPDHPNLGISNGTSLAVTLVVNDRTIGTYAAGSGVFPIDTAAMPDLPWTVEARSPSGRVLTSMRVKPGDIVSTMQPGGIGASSGTLGRVDLSCGSLRIWAGDIMPSGPAPASPASSPGDCVP